MGREIFAVDELDEIKVGDELISGQYNTRTVYVVDEVDVLGEMRVPSSDEPEYTAGVRVRIRHMSYPIHISYETLVETDLYRVSRDWSDLTHEQATAVAAKYAN